MYDLQAKILHEGSVITERIIKEEEVLPVKKIFVVWHWAYNLKKEPLIIQSNLNSNGRRRIPILTVSPALIRYARPGSKQVKFSDEKFKSISSKQDTPGSF